MLTTIVAAADKLIVAGGSITSKNSVLTDAKFRYSHHQIVAGSIFNAVVTVLLIGTLAWLAYINYGPPAKRKLAATGGVDDSDTLVQESRLLGVQPWVWSIFCFASVVVICLLSVAFYD
jgi:hypothetical protein